jgi:hypothetical protein
MKLYSAQQLAIWIAGRSLEERAPILIFAVACAWVRIFDKVVRC